AGLGVEVSEIAKHVDSVNFCLSKALGAPVGSVLCGPKAFIEEAEYWRKRMGGGMRQAGILAACGIIGLTDIINRLPDDHRRTQELAEHCLGLPGAEPMAAPTNILILRTQRPATDWQNALEKHGVRTLPFDAHRLRLVLHHQIDDEKLDHAKAALTAVAEELTTA